MGAARRWPAGLRQPGPIIAPMIGRLTGVIAEKSPPLVLIDVNGVGYELDVPMSSFYNLPGLGERATLLTHFVVREDAVQGRKIPTLGICLGAQLLAPRRQVRAVDALPTQERPEIAPLGTLLRLAQNAELLVLGETPSLASVVRWIGHDFGRLPGTRRFRHAGSP